MTLPQPAIAPAIAPVALPAPAPERARRPRVDVGDLMADLHERHGQELLRFCRWMLNDGEDAADALQDTWIRALQALGDDRVHVTALRPWLYAVARNVCLDRLRDRKRASVQELDEDAGGDAPGADEVLAIREEAGAALALVGALSERQRQALLMRELAGMSIPEIAAALGVTPDRAAWAVGDARRALEDARAGTGMACEDARAQLSRGRRTRGVRAHLGDCLACCAHDRKLRTRRLLAPALVPFLWLRRLGLPLAAGPATAATVAAT
ncbi:MAG: sigma-70 family polymerase sigma factor, partial [Solirubrobacterales bacterium]|nr:sigma-70 family polymerase sigma factor [Solirubrobacterales bacterium]